MRKKQQEYSFLDENVNYKTGVQTESQDVSMIDARRRAAEKQQKQLEAEKRQKITDKVNIVRNHEIPFGLTCTDFKIVFIMSIIAFVGNIILSLIYKQILWSNIFNIIAAIVIFFASKHLYVVQEDETDEKISNILKQNTCQVFGDVITYKFGKIFKEKSTNISDIISICSAICFAIFSSQNVMYATCVIASLFMIFLMIGLKQFDELGSHLQLLNKSLLIGLFIKAVYNVLFVSKFIQIDYMNIALLILFTCVKMWIIDNDMKL